MFVYYWLCWVFIALCRLSLVVSRDHCLLWCLGFSLWWLLELQSMGSRNSVVVARGHSHPMACGIFLDQGSNLCPLHWQVNSYPLCHQGSPMTVL